NHWFPHMKKALEKSGIEVFSPTISTSKHPTVESWMKELLPLVKDFGPDDVVIGHSLGSNAALQLVLAAKRNIGRIFLIASAIGKPRDEKHWKKMADMNDANSDIAALRRFWESNIDYAAVSKWAPRVTLIRSKDDAVIPADTHQDLPKAWKIEEWNGFGHFDSKKGTEFAALWKKIESELPYDIVPVPEKDLPVELPKVKSYEPTGTGESPLAAIDRWVDHRGMKRETNTMPQWAGSSWYYLRYMDPENGKMLVDPKKERYWSQVDFYVGGAEHATRHLIYARFWHKFLFDIGVVSTAEPFKKLQSVGLIMGEDGKKMSKRFGNVVNPDDIVGTYGADTMRIYEMFMGPFDHAIAWSTSGIMGARRFIERVWKMAEKVQPNEVLSKEAEILLNKTIKRVTEDMAAIRHNTAVSSLMILSNELDKAKAISRQAYESFLKLLAPLAPHVTEEIWRDLGNKKSIHVSDWPVADETKLEDDSATIVVQVNGKVRADFRAAKNADKASLEKAALDLDEVKKWIGDKKTEKVIVIPGKLVSIVAK
ncbi:class I tRNA ligase family protein, partial [Candidatus Parcubacteria bacterium]|nr:class I tRNA ligase family protein [Candidatus Parcubacteria bacterium]